MKTPTSGVIVTPEDRASAISETLREKGIVVTGKEILPDKKCNWEIGFLWGRESGVYSVKMLPDGE